MIHNTFSRLAAACLIGGVGILNAQSVFTADFEGPAYTPGVLVSDPDWSFNSSELTVEVIDTEAFGGLQSIRLTGDGLFRYSHDALAGDTQVQWLDFQVKPAFVDLAELSGSFGADRTAVTGFVKLNSKGEVYAVNGNSLGNGQWLATGKEVLLDGNQSREWMRVTYRLDPVKDTWDLFVDGEMVAIDLGFLNPDALLSNQFILDVDATRPTLLDDFATNSANPLFTDTSNDGLPDSWLLEHGLDININQRYQDADSDGLNNLAEYLNSTNATLADTDSDGMLDADELTYGLNPLTADVNGANGLVRRDVWTGIGGNEVWRFANNARFPLSPNKRLWVNDDLDFSRAETLGNNYGQRIYGLIVAPETGDYTFWISGDNHHELWLSTDESPANRERIAYHNWRTGYHVWDDALGSSGRIHLTAGQAYYFEILHKEFRSDDYVSVAWQYGSQSRHIIPAAHLRVNTPEAGDSDQDGLSDTWEIANGLDPYKGYGINGYASDLDGDGILNYKERLLGTRADLQDTDGDGFADGVELGMSTNPAAADIGAAELLQNIDLTQGTASAGVWTVDGSSIKSESAGGTVKLPVTLTEAGLYELEVEAAPSPVVVYPTTYEVQVFANGEFVQEIFLEMPDASGDTETLFLPWLDAGTHDIELRFVNFLQIRNIAFNALRLNRRAGQDADANGIIDWADYRLAALNAIESTAGTSRVSPYCLEGRARFTEMVRVNGQSVEPLPGDRWYENVELRQGLPTVVNVEFENAALTQSKSVVWTPTNLITSAGETMTLRKGDSLLIAAAPAGATAGQATITVGGTASDAVAVGDAIPVQFAAAGQFVVSGTWTDGAATQSGQITVEVVEAGQLADSPIAMVDTYRTWDAPRLPDAAVLEFDERSQGTLVPGAGSAGMQRWSFWTDSIQPRYIATRLGHNGPVLESQAIRGQRAASTTATEHRLVEQYEDGTGLYEVAVVLTDVYPETEVHLDIFVAGVMFEDGTGYKVLKAEDFNEKGLAYVRFLRPGTVKTSFCHRTYIYDGSTLIGQPNG